MLPAAPGARAVVRRDGAEGRISIPLWLVWMQLARRHASEAAMANPSDAFLDAYSASLAGIESAVPEGETVTGDDMRPAMMAVASAAHALDGFYGSVKPFIDPRATGRARRSRRILETLKLGFYVGRESHEWLREIDWLFNTRDNAVHHAEELRPLVVVRQTEETVVYSGSESFNFSAASAQRAADLAESVIGSCLSKPKPATAEWATDRFQHFHVALTQGNTRP
jgi:hypothetical protein